MKTRVVLCADAGKVLTDGTVYGKTVFLADGRSAEEFHEITEEEYEAVLEAEEKEMKVYEGMH